MMIERMKMMVMMKMIVMMNDDVDAFGILLMMLMSIMILMI